jgi:hypothetical protein
MKGLRLHILLPRKVPAHRSGNNVCLLVIAFFIFTPPQLCLQSSVIIDPIVLVVCDFCPNNRIMWLNANVRNLKRRRLEYSEMALNNLEAPKVPGHQHQVTDNEHYQCRGDGVIEKLLPGNPVAGLFSHGYANDIGRGTDGCSTAADAGAQ